MSVVRHGADRLRVTDADGDRIDVDRELLSGSDVVAYVTMPGRGAVALDLDDTLALLSFLADAAGVERFVPGDGAGCQSMSGGSPESNVQCLLPLGHDGWHKGLAATWSGS